MINMNEEDRELEELRRKRMEQLMAQAQKTEDIETRKEIEAQRMLILRQILTPEARERLARLRLVRPEIAEALENQLIYLAQSGKIRGMISDDQLKEILKRIMGERRDIKITRR